MITRRDFLKLSGLAAVALGMGYGAGKMTTALKQTRFFAIYGFLPADPDALQAVVEAFNAYVPRAAAARVTAEGVWAEAITAAFDPVAQPEGLFAGSVDFRLTPVSAAIDSDILVSDSTRAVYSPEAEFPAALADLRALLRNRKAVIQFSAEYRQSNRFFEGTNYGSQAVVIRSQDGIFDRIPTFRAYQTIAVPGPLGKTMIQLQDGMVRVQEAACRNRICEHTGWVAGAGDVIACAPNHLLVQIETA
ncbi:MAG: NusG domain II-containing protein [Anaerolineaceae bacterium]|nr:NusG domain II-containing protein [Anaerolineaceae bacterium]